MASCASPVPPRDCAALPSFVTRLVRCASNSQVPGLLPQRRKLPCMRMHCCLPLPVARIKGECIGDYNSLTKTGKEKVRNGKEKKEVPKKKKENQETVLPPNRTLDFKRGATKSVLKGPVVRILDRLDGPSELVSESLREELFDRHVKLPGKDDCQTRVDIVLHNVLAEYQQEATSSYSQSWMCRERPPCCRRDPRLVSPAS